jgi:hypothetical protein
MAMNENDAQRVVDLIKNMIPKKIVLTASYYQRGELRPLHTFVITDAQAQLHGDSSSISLRSGCCDWHDGTDALIVANGKHEVWNGYLRLLQRTSGSEGE